MRSQPLLATSLALLMALPLFACDPSPDPLLKEFRSKSEPIVLSGVTVVDVRDGELQKNMDVLIEGGKIKTVSPSSNGLAEAAARKIDGRGKFLIPGFVDMHVHVLGEHHVLESLALMLANGVTGFRQMSGSSDLLEARRKGMLPIPEGAPRLLAMPGSVLTPLNARNAEAGAEQVREQKAEGADFIKLGLVDADAFSSVMQESKRLGIRVAGHVPPGVGAGASSVADMRSVEHLGAMNALAIACSDRADELGKNATPPWLKKISSLPFEIPFADKILFFLLRDLLVNPIVAAPRSVLIDYQITLDTYDPMRCRQIADRFASKGTWQVPTLINTKGHLLADSPELLNDPSLAFVDHDDLERWRKVRKHFSDDFSDASKQLLRRNYTHDLALVHLLDSAGVPMMTGTDGSPGRVGVRMHGEFDELHDAGLAPLKILQMATINPAIFLGEADRWGAVEPGMRADLVLLNADPLEGVQNFHTIDAVILAGSYHDKDDLEHLKEQVRRLRSGTKAPQ